MSAKEISIVGICTALIAVISQISLQLPIGVPLTFQCFIIAVIAVVLGFKLSAFSILAYILLGFIGLPVFANFKAGPSAVLGATGGFIIGFLPMAAIIGYACDKTQNKIWLFLVLYIGLALDYMLGILQFAAVTHTEILKAVPIVAQPFLLKDVILCTIGVLLGMSLKKILKQSGLFYAKQV